MHADIEWDSQGQPISKSFGDVYFSKANGLEETRHVFFQHNQLEERWRELSENSFFVIGETGFGSGLNFLAAWDLWLKTAPESAQLHFVSVEKFPLRKDDLQKALALWPELEFFSSQLIEAYPCFVAKDPLLASPFPGGGTVPSPGKGRVRVGSSFHRLSFQQGRIKLTLIIDDAAQGFTQLLASTHPLFIRSGFKMDAWFLDGFAPSKNPEMWSDELFSAIANLSHIQTTAATFSAAAIVKNGLKNAGFSLEKVAGFGRKREMIKAKFIAEPEKPDENKYQYKGSFSPYPVPWTINNNQQDFVNKTAIVIGGGITGCHTARSLAERGWRVTLIERESDLATQASGNPQGAVYAKLSAGHEAQAEFNLHALQFALQFYAPIWQKIGSETGLLQLAYDDAEKKLHQELAERFADADELVQFVSAEMAGDLAGVDLQYSGLYFPNSGWINPKKLCNYLVDHKNISVKISSQAIQLEHKDNLWNVTTKTDENLQASVVVLANSRDAASFPLTEHLPLNNIRGQITYLPETPNLPLKTVICADGYICPSNQQQICLGATFNLKDNNTCVRWEDHQTNLQKLQEHLPALASCWKDISPEQLQGRVGFRCSLPDYLPAVGPAPDQPLMQQTFAALGTNARAGITNPGAYHPGLYLNLAQGSRGLAYTPLCAELLACIINKEPLPISQQLANALNPARFIIRNLIRRKG